MVDCGCDMFSTGFLQGYRKQPSKQLKILNTHFAGWPNFITRPETPKNVTTIGPLLVARIFILLQHKKQQASIEAKMLRTTVLFGALAAATAFSPALPTGGREFHYTLLFLCPDLNSKLHVPLECLR
jgi:hypothetical protein